MTSFGGSIHCLHGFLGLSSDWHEVIPSDLNRVCYDFFSSEKSQRPPTQLSQLGQWVNQQVHKDISPRVLLGYSLGGRVALHSLEECPDLWTGAVIVSAHPGLIQREDRESRLNSDQKWSDRFLNEDWENVVHDWNSQPVFGRGTSPLRRPESWFSRLALAEIMKGCSLGMQMDFRPFLRKVRVPILWIYGEDDAKFRSISEEIVALNPRIRGAAVPGASHRVPWDQPQIFRETLMRFLGEMYEY
jgi:2-succinyl-6-hydroxy-2,4-cyclohexadiene-1-carboxylate synthase